MARTHNTRKKRCPKPSLPPHRPQTQNQASVEKDSDPETDSDHNEVSEVGSEIANTWDLVDKEEYNECIKDLSDPFKEIIYKTMRLEDELRKLRGMYLDEKRENEYLRIQLAYLLGGHDKTKFSEALVDMISSFVTAEWFLPKHLQRKPVPTLKQKEKFKAEKATQSQSQSTPSPQPTASHPTPAKDVIDKLQPLTVTNTKLCPIRLVPLKQRMPAKPKESMDVTKPTTATATQPTSQTPSTSDLVVHAQQDLESQMLAAAFRAEEAARNVREALAANSTRYCRPSSSSTKQGNERSLPGLGTEFNLVKLPNTGLRPAASSAASSAPCEADGAFFYKGKPISPDELLTIAAKVCFPERFMDEEEGDSGIGTAVPVAKAPNAATATTATATAASAPAPAGLNPARKSPTKSVAINEAGRPIAMPIRPSSALKSLSTAVKTAEAAQSTTNTLSSVMTASTSTAPSATTIPSTGPALSTASISTTYCKSQHI